MDMEVTAAQNDKIEAMTVASVFPHYITKITKKGRTIEELYEVVAWLTGYDKKKVDDLIDKKVNFKTFFEQARINPNASLIKGVICGYRVEDITFDTTRYVRYLDKLVDELAKGRKMDKILRQPNT